MQLLEGTPAREQTQDERVLKAYAIFKRTMRRYGKEVSFPNKTEPKKTYNWRYLTKFLEKFDELQMDDRYMPRIIHAIVHHAKSHHLLERGIAMLNRNDILKLSISQLERDLLQEKESIRLIRQSYDYVMSQSTGGKLSDLLKTRINKNAYTNLTRWYKASLVSLGYIAVSRSCRKALSSLDDNEARAFPSFEELLRIRLLYVHNPNIVTNLREFMGADLFDE